ncbi:hypothetical protein NUW54_g2156 [Trametes sanguinea]|uniref:Uncharacterized protein n=1 Tax=Trametes sanguinea TaxID=158606 RepID=A0ACC1Q4B7_9APHY|nr:hypothetical protein NUW54_g2156 [Trametes sanguinea]
MNFVRSHARSKSRSPAPRTPTTPATPQFNSRPPTFFPPSHYAAAAGIPYPGDSQQTPRDYTTSFEHCPSVSSLSYPALEEAPMDSVEATSHLGAVGRLIGRSSSKRSTASLSKSSLKGEKDTEAVDKRKSRIADIPLLETHLLPSLRDTVDRMTQLPKHSDEPPVAGSSQPRPPPITNFSRAFDAPADLPSIRTALILDRFSVNCTILYCANDSLLATTTCMGRSFFDFVAKRDEDLVRSWIDVIKSWGVNERGQPSDGGFGFGKFTVLVNGRDSSIRHPDPVPSRHRHNSFAHSSQYGHHADPHSHGHHSHHSHSHSRTRDTHSHTRAHLYSPTGSGYRERPSFNERDSASSLYRIASGSTNGGSGAGTATERDRTNERSEKYNEKYGTGTADRTDKSERGKTNGRSVPVGSIIGGRVLARCSTEGQLIGKPCLSVVLPLLACIGRVLLHLRARD